MKREGRQHGMVRTFQILPNPLNPRPETRFHNRLETLATAGSFTRVSNKPTNHSKFTGKCGQPRCNGCHLRPACKAKDKTKGNQKKTKSTSDHVVMGRVMDIRPGITGYSATMILDQLLSDDYREVYYEDVWDEYREEDCTDDHDQTRENDYHDDDNREEEEEMSFVVIEEDDNWCLV